MKAFKNLSIFALLFFMPFGNGQAQNQSGNQIYTIHEDIVLPSKIGEYEKTIKEFMDSVKKYNIPGAKWITTQTNDFKYLYVQPIPNMAELDNNKFWMTLSEKMGADKLTDLFKRMNQCYDIHADYILTLDKDLSYMPGGITQTPAGQDYRRFYYLYVDPKNTENLTKSLKAVKDLFQQKGSKMEYRIYRSGFGAPRDFFMVAVAAKDGQTFEAMDAANNALLGADGEKDFGDMLQYVAKYEEVTGRMRPDLAYTPK